MKKVVVATLVAASLFVFSEVIVTQRASASPPSSEKAKLTHGTWRIAPRNEWSQIYHGKIERRYQICNNGPDIVRVLADNQEINQLAAGDCGDVEGKTLLVEVKCPNCSASGTYESLALKHKK